MITVLWVQQYDISVVLLWWVRTASCRRACIKIKMLLLTIIFFHWVYLCVVCVYTCTRALPYMKYSSIFWACSLYYTNLKYEKWHTLVSFLKHQIHSFISHPGHHFSSLLSSHSLPSVSASPLFLFPKSTPPLSVQKGSGFPECQQKYSISPWGKTKLFPSY